MPTTVSIVDDEFSVRDSLRALIESAGYEAETYASAEEFLGGYEPSQPGCIVLDERMPGMCGRALQEELVRQGALSPVILITAHAEVPMAVEAMRLGALTVIQKPFHDQALLDAIGEALALDESARARHRDRRVLEARLAALTPRQRDVMELLIRGLSNKMIANELGISDRTAELHRLRVLRRMEARSAAELAFAVGLVRGQG